MVTPSEDRRQPDDALWKYNDVARYVGVHRETVVRWVKERRIPFRRIGRSVRFIPVEIRAWVAEHGGARKGAA